MLRLALVFLLAATLPAAAQETRIAAVVNEDVISVSDLNDRLRLVLVSSSIEDSAQTRQRVAPQVLRTMIDEKLQLQEAKRLNVRVTEGELQDTYRRIEAQNRLPAGGLDAYLKERGISKASFDEQINATISWAKLVRRRFGQSVSISDDEINEAFERLKEREGQSLSRVAEIFLAVDDPRQEDEIRRFAERLIEQMRAGAPFSAIAQQFSQSATAAVGGDIGWVAPGQLAPELAQAIERLNPGDLSVPVRGAGGWYVLGVIEKRVGGRLVVAPPPPPPRTIPEATSVTLVQVLFPIAPDAPKPDLDRAAQAAQQVASQAKSCDDMRRLGRERAPQTSGDLGRIRVADLPPELRQPIGTLEVGQPTPPIVLRGGIGTLMVCAREAPAAPPPPPPPAPIVSEPTPLPSREEIAEGLTRQKLDNLARRYVRDLRRTAFIDVRV